MPKSPQFSIIIPTLNRATYLKNSIKSCLKQNFTDFEVIIHDNFSNDNTHEVVTSFNDSRIKYFRTQKRFSMTENWNAAIEKAAGHYITVIGDDDALLPCALDTVYNISKNYDTYAIKHWPVQYYYKGVGGELDDILTFVKDYSGKIYKRSPREELQKIYSQAGWYGNLALIYHAFIKKELIDEIIDKHGTPFLQMAMPDIYAALLLTAYMDKDYIELDIPLSIGAQCPLSNGFSYYSNEDDSRYKEFVEDFKKDFPKHSSMSCESIALCVLESLENIKTRIQDNFIINYSAFIQTALKEYNTIPEARKESFLKILKESAEKFNCATVLSPQDTKEKHFFKKVYNKIINYTNCIKNKLYKPTLIDPPKGHIIPYHKIKCENFGLNSFDDIVNHVEHVVQPAIKKLEHQ